MAIQDIAKSFLAEGGRVVSKPYGRFGSVVEATKVRPDVSIFEVFGNARRYYESEGFKAVEKIPSHGVLKLEKYGNRDLVLMTIYEGDNPDKPSLRITFREFKDEDKRNSLLRFID